MGHQTTMKFFETVRRGLRFWLASFGQLPGMIRDQGFVSAPSADGAGGEPAAPRLELPEMTSGAQALAEEMAWGVVLRLETKSSASASSARLRM